MLGFAVAYTAWVLWVAFAADIWVYPFLKKLDAVFISAFFAAAFAVALFIYFVGEWVAVRKWVQDSSLEKKTA